MRDIIIFEQNILREKVMSCPFLDPSMLARLPAEKREEMKEMYHRMKQEQSDHLKIDIKEDEIDSISPE